MIEVLIEAFQIQFFFDFEVIKLGLVIEKSRHDFLFQHEILNLELLN